MLTLAKSIFFFWVYMGRPKIWFCFLQKALEIVPNLVKKKKKKKILGWGSHFTKISKILYYDLSCLWSCRYVDEIWTKS